MSDLMDPIRIDPFWLEDEPIRPPEPLSEAAAERYRYFVKYAKASGEKVNENLYRIWIAGLQGKVADDELVRAHRMVPDRSIPRTPDAIAFLIQTNGRKVRTLGTRLPPFEANA